MGSLSFSSCNRIYAPWQISSSTAWLFVCIHSSTFFRSPGMDWWLWILQGIYFETPTVSRILKLLTPSPYLQQPSVSPVCPCLCLLGDGCGCQHKKFTFTMASCEFPHWDQSWWSTPRDLVVVDLKWVSRLPSEVSLSPFLPLRRSFLSLSQFSGHLQSSVYSPGTRNFPFCLFAALRVVHTRTSSNILPAPPIPVSDPSYLLADWHWSQGGCTHPCRCFLMQWRDWVVIVLREPGGVWSAFQAG